MAARNPGPTTWRTSWCLHAKLHGHACLGACQAQGCESVEWNQFWNKVTSPSCAVSHWVLTILAMTLEHYFPWSLYKDPSLQRTPRMRLKLQWLPADSEQTTKINVNSSPGPDGTQPRNFKGTQAWNRWITNTTVCNLSIKNILVAEDHMVPKVTDF